MRLHRFEIRNFKSIESLSFDWEDLVVLIGENNCGKSSVLAAISWFLSGSAIRDASLFRRHQTALEDAIELVGHFDQLTEDELRQVAIRGRTHNGEWILKKRFWYESGGEDAERGGWKEQLFSFSSAEVFAGWPEADTTWTAFPEDYQPLIQQLPARGPRPNAATKEALRQLVRINRADLVAQGAPAWTANPGGGGNWKSNANSVIPRPIFVRAVHEASEETVAKDVSTYGKLINLIVERQISQRPEMVELQAALEAVLRLFHPNEEHPEQQAEEIRGLQDRINQRLSEVIAGEARIRTVPPELRELVMPNTSLVIRDPLANIETHVDHQGHGLQRTLVMTLLQLLSEFQGVEGAGLDPIPLRPTILIVEEPELYLHPQMERLMRDVLYKLAMGPSMQVACCTHSPIFLDIANKYRSIVRVTKSADGRSTGKQVTGVIFRGADRNVEKEQIQTVARFHPTINELFFAKHVVLFEEFSAIAALERHAELSGLFNRHPRIRREVSLIDCDGKQNIPAFQRILNEFGVAYRVVHDRDENNPVAFAYNARIAAAFPAPAPHPIYVIGPDLEGLLGHQIPKSQSKPFANVRRVEELHEMGAVPRSLTEAINMMYFGQAAEPHNT